MGFGPQALHSPSGVLAGQRLGPRTAFRNAVAGSASTSRPVRRLQLGVASVHPGSSSSSSGRHAAPRVAAVPRAGEEGQPQKGGAWGALASQIGKGVAVCALAAALALGPISPAEAARSGGRMGGSSFSGRASSSFSSSLGSSRGMGLGSSLGTAMARSSRSSMGRMGGSSGLSSRTLGGGGLRASSPLGYSFGMPSLFFSPFGFGYGYPMGGGGGLTTLLFWGVFGVILLQVVQGVLGRRGGDAALDSSSSSGGAGRVTVAKVQVGLLGSARELQRDLERIASRADTTSPSGLHYVLQETVLALMRNPDYCLYAASSSDTLPSPDKAETRFNELSLQERGKFEAETLVNVGGRSKRGALSRPPTAGGSNELIVVTLLVAAEGSARLPNVSSRGELKAVLARLGALRSDDVLAVEVLWTPEEEGDYFTRDDLAYDYPTLNTL